MLVNVYRKPEGRELFHLDAYRLDTPAEAEELDIDEMLSRGALVVEWPERVQPALPGEQLWATFENLDEDQRQMRFKANGSRYEALLGALRRDVYGGD